MPNTKQSGFDGIDEDDTPSSVESSFLDILQVVVDNLRFLVFGSLAVGVIAVGVSYLLAPTYTATAKFLPPQQQQSTAVSMLQSLGALGSLTGAAGLKNPSDQYVAFLSTRTVQDALIDRYQLLSRYEQRYRQETRKILFSNSKILAGKDGLITIEFEDKDPEFAANIANAYVEELGKLLNRLAVTEAQQRRAFFEGQLSTTKENLIKSEQALAASGISPSALNATPSIALEGPARLRAQLTAQEIKLASLRSYLKESAPEFKQAAAELAELRRQLSKVEREQPSGVGSSNDYIAKYREFKYQETLFELFSRQYEMAKIDESREGAVVQVVDTALPPEFKSSPKRALIGIGAFVLTAFIILTHIFVKKALQGSGKSNDNGLKLAQLRTSFRRQFGRRSTGHQ